jgi:hypothetical protein
MAVDDRYDPSVGGRSARSAFLGSGSSIERTGFFIVSPFTSTAIISFDLDHARRGSGADAAELKIKGAAAAEGVMACRHVAQPCLAHRAQVSL